jgi:hypothetical protein
MQPLNNSEAMTANTNGAQSGKFVRFISFSPFHTIAVVDLFFLTVTCSLSPFCSQFARSFLWVPLSSGLVIANRAVFARQATATRSRGGHPRDHRTQMRIVQPSSVFYEM